MEMDYPTANAHTTQYPLGPRVVEGKTKAIYQVKGKPGLVLVLSKDDLTAGDGARHVLLPGKGVWANQTTCNTFRLLKEKGYPVAFETIDNVNSFVARECRMLPLEVVVRRVAAGSFLKREPTIRKGYRFKEPRIEFYLKTKGKTWRSWQLPCDDPLLLPDERGEQFLLYRPGLPLGSQEPCCVLDTEDVFLKEEDAHLLPEMGALAGYAFQLLEEAWAVLGLELVDYKVEFGIGPNGDLLLADVIDNDSWRLLRDGVHVDKQLFRDGHSIEEIGKAYQYVAEMSDRLCAA